MSTFAIRSKELVLPSGIDGFGYLVIQDGKFGGVSIEEPADMPIVDRTDCWVAPGFVDTHIHGFANHDVMDCDPQGLNVVCERLAAEGTTSWLATTLTASAEKTGAACASVREAYEAQKADPDFVGARTQGIFLEGPFFTEEHKGAQDPR